MNELSLNRLYARGKSDEVTKFFDFITEHPNLGEYFQELEEEMKGNDDIISVPWSSRPATSSGVEINLDDKSIDWESQFYPSFLTVYNLSKKFPAIYFFFDFDNTEESICGKICISDGCVEDYHYVDFDEDPIDLLLENYKFEIMSLKLGEKIEVGLGMIIVECIGEEDTEDEITKEFSLGFQCDGSPKIIVHIDKDDDNSISLDMDFIENDEWSIDCVEYSDDDENETAADSGYRYEMCAHADRTPKWWEDMDLKNS